MSKRSKYTVDSLGPLVAKVTSVRQLLKELKLKPLGGNYANLQKVLKKLNIDTSHFTGQGWNRGKKFGPKKPISDYLNNSNFITSDRLKKRLLDEKIFEYRCQSCLMATWYDQPIPLELHHIDKNHENNNLSNLQILCPICHYFADRNIKLK